MPELADQLRAALSDRYSILRELGRGGMATVYLAHDLRHDRPVALKVLDPELGHAVGPERFLQEIRVTARLQHPHILPIHDSGTSDGLLWYTMPFVDGESLRARLQRERQLPMEDVRRIGVEVADALGYAHEQSVVHRDIKPENILLSAGGHALVADFGVARAAVEAGAERLTGTGLTLGTPAYMSPEQASGARELDGRSDLYSLGCVLYEMLAGAPPFTGPTPQAVIARRFMEAPMPLRFARAAVPPRLERVVSRALAREPVDRFPDAAEFSRALVAAAIDGTVSGEPSLPTLPVRAGGAARRPWQRVARPVLAVLLLLAIGGTGWLWQKGATSAVLDADLIALAPFDVLDPGLQVWQEGLVDLLARALDGAGPLRTVAPTIVVRHWRGRADPASVLALCRATGAGLAVYGTVMRTGRDSVRLSATVMDALRERALGEIEVRGAATRMDRLTDSLAIGVLRQLGRSRAVGAVRYAGIGARSLPALRAYLQAEQQQRRGAWDSVRAYAEQAVALDTTFALAYRRLAGAIAWQGDAPLALDYAVRAAALNHGLAPRDSLLIAADSLAQVLASSEHPARGLSQRLMELLDDGVRRYPNDPEVWYSLAEARHHFGGRFAWTEGWHGALDAYKRTIALDPLFAPAYFHPVELSYALGDTASARQFASTAFRLNPQSPQAIGRYAVQRLLALPDSAAQSRVIDGLSARARLELYDAVAPWTDANELAVRVARHLASPGLVAHALAFRGHLRAALAVGDTASRFVFAEAAVLGVVSADQARARFDDWLRNRPLEWPALALVWWGAQRDTLALRRFLRRIGSTARARGSPEDSARAERMSAATRAQLALVRGDSARALRAYEPLLDVTCAPWCQGDQLLAARLLSAASRLEDASNVLGRAPLMEGSSYQPRPSDVLWYLERARVAERRGFREPALEAYRLVVSAWAHPDPELEPFAAEARSALVRLSPDSLARLSPGLRVPGGDSK